MVSSDGAEICTLRDLTVARHFIKPSTPVSRRFEVVSQPVALTPTLSRALRPTGVDAQATSRFYIHWYRMGNELELQASLKAHDVNSTFSVWIIAREGSDGDGARGFTRSLRREMTTWAIMLLVAARTLEEPEVEALACRLSSVPDLEHELYLDRDYCVYVPRIHEVSLSRLPAPSTGNYASTSTSMTKFFSLGNFLPSRLLELASAVIPLGDESFKRQETDAAHGHGTALFDSSGVYILVGGVGSLGLHIALWMYEVRKVV